MDSSLPGDSQPQAPTFFKASVQQPAVGLIVLVSYINPIIALDKPNLWRCPSPFSSLLRLPKPAIVMGPFRFISFGEPKYSLFLRQLCHDAEQSRTLQHQPLSCSQVNIDHR